MQMAKHSPIMIATGMLLYKTYLQKKQSSDCCGIVGYLGNKPQGGTVCI